MSFYDQNILDEIRDNLIKRLISGGYAGAAFDASGREKILRILRREKKLNHLINGKY